MREQLQDNLCRIKNRWAWMTAGLVVMLAVLLVAAICLGKYDISPGDSLRILFGRAVSDPMAVNVVYGLRLPRIFASVFCGAALALSGAAYQGVFGNPLISPDFLGVSQGACVGAALAILGGFASVAIQVSAFLGGIAAVVLTLAIPALIRSNSHIMLVLSGIIVGGLMSSILGFLKYVADPETQLASITYWQLGSFSYIRTNELLAVMPFMAVPAIVLIGLAWRIDIVSLGETDAKSLGTNVGLIRALAVVCATLLIASAVCIAGTIGWVGLVIPHFTRILVGNSNRRLFPAACLIGAIFMLVVDTVTRLIGPAEMPISILTGIIGAPFYAWLLYKRRGAIQ